MYRILLGTAAALAMGAAAQAQTINPNLSNTFTQRGTGAVAQSLASKLGQVLNVADYGVTTASANNATALQAAENYCSSVGGVLDFPAGTILTGSIEKRSNCSWRGQGRGVTVLKLVNGVNTDLVAGQNAASLWGTNSGAGISDFKIADITLDGNRPNQTAGSCLAIYAFRYVLDHVTLQNCKDFGVRTEWGDAAVSMEAYWSDILVDTTGLHGVQFMGPHDSHIDRLTIIDAGQGADNTSYGLYLAGNGNGRFFGFHGWHRGATTNRTAFQYYTVNGSNTFSGSHFEGSDQAGAYIGGALDTFDATNLFYSPWKPNTPSVIVAGSNNVVHGTVLGSAYIPNTPPRYGLQLSGAGNVIAMSIVNSTLGAINFVSGEALNQVTVNAAQSTGPGYVGTISADDTFLFTNYGATSNGSVNRIPGLRRGTTTYGGLTTVDPAPSVGDQWLVSDASTCTVNTAVTAGGGTHSCPVIRSSTSWIAQITN